MSAIWETTLFENAIFAMFRMLKIGDKSAYANVLIVETLLHTPNIVPNPLVDSGNYFAPLFPPLPNSCIIWRLF